MIETFLRYIEKEKRYSVHTVTAYKKDIESFAEYIESNYECTDLLQCNQEMARSWLSYLASKNYSTKSIHRKKTSLSVFFRFYIYKGIISKNPILNIPVPKIKQRLPEFIEEKTMIKEETTERKNLEFPEYRDLMIFEILYATGMRRSELINLTDADIDNNRKLIKVIGKRNKERLIPFGKKMSDMITEYTMLKNDFFEGITTDSNFLLINTGKKMYPNFVYRKIKSILSTFSTLKKKSPHVLRHTFATHMLNNGADLSAIKELLGHANLSATQIYTHTNIKQLQEIYSKAHPKS